MSEDKPLRLRRWGNFNDRMTITLTRSPATAAEEARVHQAVQAFVRSLTVSESPDGPESPGLNQEQSS